MAAENSMRANGCRMKCPFIRALLGTRRDAISSDALSPEATSVVKLVDATVVGERRFNRHSPDGCVPERRSVSPQSFRQTKSVSADC
jgi:hypothetical protein